MAAEDDALLARCRPLLLANRVEKLPTAVGEPLVTGSWAGRLLAPRVDSSVMRGGILSILSRVRQSGECKRECVRGFPAFGDVADEPIPEKVKLRGFKRYNLSQSPLSVVQVRFIAISFVIVYDSYYGMFTLGYILNSRLLHGLIIFRMALGLWHVDHLSFADHLQLRDSALQGTPHLARS